MLNGATTLYGRADRQSAWQSLASDWDLIIVGGGITGAGILREAVRFGLRALLLEQGDFASGTSSRSSKLVHGGVRYIANLQLRIVRESALERDELLREGAGLIEPLPFIYSIYRTDKIRGWVIEMGMRLYSWLVGRWKLYQRLRPSDLSMLVPGLSLHGMTAAFRYREAQTDDARLVLRVLREAAATGRAVILNYARVEGLLRGADGLINGVSVCDRETGQTTEVRARAVINATGAWADKLRGEVGAPPRIRPLRGAHLIFPAHRLPVYQSIAFSHPDDRRPVFVFPWEGVTLVGTTDLDHREDLDEEAAPSPEEISYLLRAVQVHFSELALTEADIMAAFAGVRPVISSGRNKAPSKESRDHVLWDEDGLITVTGGKLTTFRHIALATLAALRSRLPDLRPFDMDTPALDPMPPLGEPPRGLSRQEALRLAARYGIGILDFARTASPEQLGCIDGLPIHWLELSWAARYESVRHLDDLLLRRVRLGLLAPNGGEALLPKVRALAQPVLGWDDAQWDREQAAYLEKWQRAYSGPR